jgi:hypothetical protein
LQVEYASGGHGAALEEGWWDAIARFIVDGPPRPQETPGVVAGRRSGWLVVVGKLAPLVWILILAVLTAGLIPLLRLKSPSVRTASVLGYLVSIYKILTRF